MAHLDDQLSLPVVHRSSVDSAALTTPALVLLAGISYRQADFWTRAGLLVPRVPAAGSGSKRLYDPAEARIAWFMGIYTRLGLAPAQAAYAARNGGWLDRQRTARVTLTPEALRHAPDPAGHQIPDGPVQAVPV